MAKSLLRSTGVVSSMTLISRLVGFTRDMVVAQLFGAGFALDAFFVAFKIPNFMRRLSAEGAFSQAFVPVLAEYSRTRSQEEVRLFISYITGMLGAALLLITLLAEIASPLIVTLFAPGFLKDPIRFTLASDMLRITFPYMFFISLAALSGAILNTYNRFAVPAFTPVFLNLSMIWAAFYLSPQFASPIMGLAWGVCVAGVLQLLFQLPFLWRLRMLPLPRIRLRDQGVLKVLTLMIPALFGVSVAQISMLIDTLFASFLPVGSVSWLYYSDR
jgi:putative peptidoglycan lipid II flippase